MSQNDKKKIQNGTKQFFDEEKLTINYREDCTMNEKVIIHTRVFMLP